MSSDLVARRRAFFLLCILYFPTFGLILIRRSIWSSLFRSSAFAFAPAEVRLGEEQGMARIRRANEPIAHWQGPDSEAQYAYCLISVS
jgi:hypothetical protein